ncbi:hypothetical protein C8Q76DRAFT_179971 [Earliella scabrosa]|nr:hypothetical protein C8Q76DRAFT_179971 [Earliella scabrosa]
MVQERSYQKHILYASRIQTPDRYARASKTENRIPDAGGCMYVGALTTEAPNARTLRRRASPLGGRCGRQATLFSTLIILPWHWAGTREPSRMQASRGELELRTLASRTALELLACTGIVCISMVRTSSPRRKEYLLSASANCNGTVKLKIVNRKRRRKVDCLFCTCTRMRAVMRPLSGIQIFASLVKSQARVDTTGPRSTGTTPHAATKSDARRRHRQLSNCNVIDWNRSTSHHLVPST